MHFFPILSTLRRHRTAALLIILEITLTCAIVCNAVFLITDRLSRANHASGIIEDELLRIKLTGISAPPDASAVTAQDLNALRAIPGVKSVASTNVVPFGVSSWTTTVLQNSDDQAPEVYAALYVGSQDLLKTLGVQLIAGRDFTPDEFFDFELVKDGKAHMPSVIITRGVAERLFPGRNPLGQSLYVWNKDPQTVVGVVDVLARPKEGIGKYNPAWSVISPANISYALGGNYLIRVDPTRKTEVLAAAEAALNKVEPNRIILERQTFDDVRKNYFKQDRAMAYLLIGVSAALLIVTALGIIGLASFWVQQRTRQIGIRRALGATRADILRYFQLENFILATIGIAIGMPLAYGINLSLIHTYQIPRLPGGFLPIGAVLLWLLGQTAVLGPALRASAIPPAIATRTS